jgi:hypothetical protein
MRTVRATHERRRSVCGVTDLENERDGGGGRQHDVRWMCRFGESGMVARQQGTERRMRGAMNPRAPGLLGGDIHTYPSTESAASIPT